MHDFKNGANIEWKTKECGNERMQEYKMKNTRMTNGENEKRKECKTATIHRWKNERMRR